MRITFNLILTLLLLALTVCSFQASAANVVPTPEAQFAQDYLQKLQSKDFDYVKKHLDPALAEKVTDQGLQRTVAYFPPGTVISTELIGAQVTVIDAMWSGDYTFEYHFSDGWAVANVVLRKNGDAITVAGFHVYRTKMSQQEFNKFTLSGKSVLQYAVLIGAVLACLFSLVTTIVCIRTPIKRRKWLWVLFVALGFGSLTINWTTGAYAVQLLAFNLLSAAAYASGSSAPWQILVSLPIGAFLFWWNRAELVRDSSPGET